jgi:hypothetical protein
MKDQLISFETAKLAKEKGFDIKTKHWYDQTTTLNPVRGARGAMCYDNVGYAPTQSLLQKWLREIHKIYVASYHDLNPKHDGIIYYTCWGFINDPSDEKLAYNPLGGYDEFSGWKTYEEALEFGLQESLKLI